jgi:TPR repeat protein
MAADQGITAAESNIGWMVARGEGVTKDCSIARQWLEKAAAAGDASAKNNLGNGVNGACPWGIIR